MKRLTEGTEGGYWRLGEMSWSEFSANNPKKDRDLLYAALCKLKDYEDTGLTPTQVAILTEDNTYDESVGEEKQKICDSLCATLQTTREGHDVESIEYRMAGNHEETATVIFDNGYSKEVNVTADSGLAMIKDICEHI